MPPAPSARYEFGPFRIDPERQLVLRDGKPLPITPKVFGVLLTLVRRCHRVVRKDELLQAVWPGRVVEESNLSQCIFVLRKLLGDARGERCYIVTLPGKGYRFAAEVHRLPADDQGVGATGPFASPGADGSLAGSRAGSRALPATPAAGTERAGAAHVPQHDAPPRIAYARGTSTAPPRESIAVLPFSSDAGAGEQQYFSDGLAEGLITALSQFAGLRVISRNSAFQFRDRQGPAIEVGRQLGVAHLLEGSVRRQGNDVRVIITLVNTADGSVVLSQRYDRPYACLFALQDAIVGAVASTLQTRLLNAPGAVTQSDRPPNGSLAAWTAFEHGRAYEALATEAGARSAITAYQHATQLDSGYAAAYACLTGAWIGLWSAAGATTTGTIRNALANARAAASIALRLDAGSSRAHQAHARLLHAGMDWEGAKAEAERALRLAPNDPEARPWLAATLATLGRVQQASELVREALVADPRRASWYKWLAIYLAARGRLDDAHAAIDTAIALQPGTTDAHAQLALLEILRGDADAAASAARREAPGLWGRIASALALQIGSDRSAADIALAELVAAHAEDAPYQIAGVYALRHAPDESFQWLERAWLARDGGMGNLLFDPLLLRYRVDPRFTCFCAKIGLPATTDAIAIE